MKGINLVQQCKVVPLHYPASGGCTCVAFSMANHAHASVIIVQGSATSAGVITVLRSSDNASTVTSAIPFSYAEETTSGFDLLGALTSTGVTGTTMSTGNKQFKVLEIDSSQLSSAAKYVIVNMATPQKSGLAAIAVLSGSRYQEDETRTVL